jgi:hypothetical protein
MTSNAKLLVSGQWVKQEQVLYLSLSRVILSEWKLGVATCCFPVTGG